MSEFGYGCEPEHGEHCKHVGKESWKSVRGRETEETVGRMIMERKEGKVKEYISHLSGCDSKSWKGSCMSSLTRYDKSGSVFLVSSVGGTTGSGLEGLFARAATCGVREGVFMVFKK